MPYLPGNINDRLRELRESRHLSEREAAEQLGINPSTYSRMEKADGKVSHENIIKAAEFYDVSADFLLGITNIPERTYYDISELGLTVQAAENLLKKKYNMNVINRLLTNDSFAGVVTDLGAYLDGRMDAAWKVQKDISNLVIGTMHQMARNEPVLEKGAKAASLETEQLFKNRIYDPEVITRGFVKVIKELKSEATDSEQTKETSKVTHGTLNAMRGKLMETDGIQTGIKVNDIGNLITGSIKTAADFDGNEEDGVQFLNGISGFLMNIAEDLKTDTKGSEDLEEAVKES